MVSAAVISAHFPASTVIWSPRPFESTNAVILVFSPPLVRPIASVSCPPAGIGGVLMGFYVRGIQVNQCTLGFLYQQIQHLRPKARLIPSAPSGINRTPGAKMDGQISPRASHAKNIKHGLNHSSIILRWDSHFVAPASALALLFCTISRRDLIRSQVESGIVSRFCLSIVIASF